MEEMEKRLAMIQQLKQEQAQNRDRMYRRDRIVYGPDSVKSYKSNDTYRLTSTSEKDTSQTPGFKSIYVRFAICAAIFLCFCYMKQNDTDIYGVKASHINKIISQKVDVNSFAFLQNFPYTLEE